MQLLKSNFNHLEHWKENIITLLCLSGKQIAFNLEALELVFRGKIRFIPSCDKEFSSHNYCIQTTAEEETRFLAHGCWGYSAPNILGAYDLHQQLFQTTSLNYLFVSPTNPITICTLFIFELLRNLRENLSTKAWHTLLHTLFYPPSRNDNWLFSGLKLSHLSIIQLLIWVLQ